jgi:hypothetical protein
MPIQVISPPPTHTHTLDNLHTFVILIMANIITPIYICVCMVNCHNSEYILPFVIKYKVENV